MRQTAWAVTLGARLGVRPDPWTLRAARKMARVLFGVAVVYLLAYCVSQAVLGLGGG